MINFNIVELSTYKSCKLDIQNLQKISEKVEQTGLIALVGLSKKIVSFYNEISENCEKNKLKTTKMIYGFIIMCLWLIWF